MNMEAKFSALKVYIDCEISILNSKVDLFIESLKETITKIEKLESSSKKILQENIRFLQKELLAKNDLIKSLMETQTVVLEAITNLKEKPQDQRELSNITYKQQIQQHQGHQNKQQKFLKNTKQQQNHIVNFKVRGNSSNYKNNNSNSRNYNIKLGSSNINNKCKNSNNKNYIVINQKQSL